MQDMVLHMMMAIEALRDLDGDNRMVTRCRDYLEQLVQVVHALGTVTCQIYGLRINLTSHRARLSS